MAVIECHRVAKRYQRGISETSLREALARLAGRLAGRQAADPDLFWALQDVSFAVEAGELLGIIGHNGAGKSTILKLLARITRPTSGSVHTRGRLAALIELGAGFHPDLTGRENIFLNGAMLGLRRDEIRRQLEAIVDFAEIEPFIDTPIKRYSSGMYLRLAFAIAAHVRADLLLVDEMLAVGDTAFQAKCLARMRELNRDGATIVLISHDTWTVQRFCRRALLLDHGLLVADGDPEAVIERYQEGLRGDLHGDIAPPVAAHPQVQIVRVELRDESGETGRALNFGERLSVYVHYSAPQPLEALLVLRIRRADGLLCCALNSRDNPEVGLLPAGEGAFAARIGPLPLVPDFYRVEAMLVDRVEPLLYAAGASELFRIRGGLANARDAGVFAPDIVWMGVAPRGLSDERWAAPGHQTHTGGGHR